jgi:glucokinase
VIERACLINDFIGVGLGLTAVDPSHVLPLHDVPRVAGAPMVGIGAGTGLGEVRCTSACFCPESSQFQVYLTCAGTERVYSAWPSEGGMSEFNAHTQQVRHVQGRLVLLSLTLL